MLPQVVSSRETMANCSPRLLLAKLHDEFAMGRVRFVTARSIGRLRQALHGLYSAIGGSSSARHAARFNLLGKSHRLGCDIDFAEKVITTFDRKKTRACKRAVLAGERMAIRIHIGDVRGSSRRNAGSWAAQSNMSAALGSSECKTFCNNIIKRHRKRSKSSRLSTPLFSLLGNASQLSSRTNGGLPTSEKRRSNPLSNFFSLNTADHVSAQCTLALGRRFVS